MNFAPKASGAASGTQSMSHLTFYCTGMTSGPLVTTGAHNIIVQGQAELTNLNVTGQVWDFNVVLSTNIPSQTFGAGRCASITGASVTTVEVYAAIASSSLLWEGAFNLAPNKPAATYYAWLDVLPLTTDAQANLQMGANSQLSMLEVK